MNWTLAAYALAVLLLWDSRRTRRKTHYEAQRIMTALDTLRAQVASNTSVTESAITLLKGLKDKLDAAIVSDDSDADLQKLSDELASETQKLAEAVSANTPAVAAPVADVATANTATPAFEDLPADHPLKGGTPTATVPDVTGPVTDPAVVNAPGSPIANK